MDQEPDHLARAVREAIDAFLRGDVDAVLRRLHPEFEMRFDSGLLPGGTRFRGHDNIRVFYEALASSRLEIEVDVVEARTRGSHVLTLSRTSARGPGNTGFATRGASIWTFEGDLLRHMTGYLDATDGKRAFERLA